MQEAAVEAANEEETRVGVERGRGNKGAVDLPCVKHGGMGIEM